MLKAILVLVISVSVIHGEYVWTGTEWKWQEPSNVPQAPSSGGSSSSSSFGGVEEGSGGGGDSYNFDDEDDYDYDDENYSYDDDYEEPSKKNDKKNKNKWGDYGSNNKKDKKKNKNKNKFDTGILPATDDEDFVEGSGNDDFNIPRNNYNDNNNNNNDFNNNNNNYNFNNPVDIDSGSNQNVYVDNDDDSYDDDYDYDENYDDDDDDINFGMPEDNNSWNNFAVTTTSKPSDAVFNMNNVNNVWENPVVTSTQASYTPRTTTVRPTPKPDQGSGPEVHKTVPVNRPASFFAQPGILAAVIGGAVVGLLCAILLVMFIVYRMRKKDEGSYALDEPKRSHNVNSYSKPPSREFYA